MSDDQQTARAAMLLMINRRAIELVEIPPQEREVHYAIIRASLRDTADTMQLPPDQARALVAKLEQWIRELVDFIEQGGSASGGHA